MLGTYGLGIVTVACAAWASLATWSVHDPSLNNATRAAPRNVLGNWGAVVADLAIQSLGLASIILFLPLAAWGWHLVFRTVPKRRRLRLLAWPAAVILLAAALAALPQPKSWPLPNGLGGIFGDFFMAGAHVIGPFLPDAAVSFVAGLAFLVVGTMLLLFACGTSTSRLIALWAPRSTAAGEWASASLGAAMHFVMHVGARLKRIARIFDEQGEAAFRALERTVVAGLTGPLVVDLGGGAFCDPPSALRLLGTARVFFLDVSAAEASRRLGGGEGRPLAGRWERLLAARLPLYRRAHHTLSVDGRTAEAVARTIVDLVEVSR